jgi:signal transduction histidine kinase
LSVRGIIGRFAFAGFLAMTVVAGIVAVLSQRAGRDEAIRDAREITRLIAEGVVEPAITPELIEGLPSGATEMDRVMRASVIRGSLVRVKIWDESGTVLYSDQRELIGERYELGADELEVLHGAPTAAEVSDLSRSENRLERDQGQLLEAYTAMTGPNGEQLLFEGYFRYAAVVDAGRAQWRRFAPVSLGAVLVMELVQIPIVWSVARRFRSAQRERELLLQNAVDSGDAERRRIASDLHDGVVQDLSGVSLSLAAVARSANASEHGVAPVLDQAAAQVRESVRSLRSLLVEIYPPNLEQAGLESALGDLLARCSNRGLDASLEFDPRAAALELGATGLIYRGAQEAVRNVLKHARATRVSITVVVDGDLVRLAVDDDGVGVNTTEFETKPGAGHVGLRVLGDLVAGSGGELVLAPTAGGGTSFRMTLPLGKERPR